MTKTITTIVSFHKSDNQALPGMMPMGTTVKGLFV